MKVLAQEDFRYCTEILKSDSVKLNKCRNKEVALRFVLMWKSKPVCLEVYAVLPIYCSLLVFEVRKLSRSVVLEPHLCY